MPFTIPFTQVAVYSKHEIDTMFRGVIGLSGVTSQPGQVIVASWTSSGGRYYYDLVHGKGAPPIIAAWNLMANHAENFDELQITNYTTTVRVWMAWQPAANQILLRYF